MNRHSAFAVVATAVVLAGVVLGFRSIGGPGKQREVAADERRGSDLSRLSAAISRWYFREKKLPVDVYSLQGKDPTLSVRDPVTNVPYEYKPGEDASYQLCATFALDSTGIGSSAGQDRRFVLHAAGRHCFDLYAGASSY